MLWCSNAADSGDFLFTRVDELLRLQASEPIASRSVAFSSRKAKGKKDKILLMSVESLLIIHVLFPLTDFIHQKSK